MTEPQEVVGCAKTRVLMEQRIFTDRAISAGRDMPLEIQRQAEIKKENFNQVKAELDTDMADILSRLQALELKFQANIHNSLNQDGVLTCEINDYLNCLKLNYRGLESLFRKDEIKWDEVLKNARKQASQINSELEYFLEKQTKELEHFLKQREKVRKIPLLSFNNESDEIHPKNQKKQRQ